MTAGIQALLQIIFNFLYKDVRLGVVILYCQTCTITLVGYSFCRV